ncbi:SDR family NAD(P)-dependent oxidoreductase [[Clostridium] polysaccharolyticum]|jgi:short-subunit dehydrogenase|uniref:Short-chain dehydrogenase n=1 Tax=[Clostridium] polysaccharolyticum TaxID=29364 RepID=A0A1I0DQZ2_9FIRM|nr:SDR family oxidoreductase [[Clostridium] polysaccharolyticum]SET34844.1 Short-chain dehydrogenase [[Clostridium] polysaccharolyticum]
MLSLKGKWALVTGASRGIGRLVSLFLAEKGCNLILQSRDIANTKEVVKKAEGLGVKAVPVSAELSELKTVETMLQEIDQLNVDVDIVMNNAGLQVGYREDYYKTPVSDYTTSFFVNTIAPMMICYHFLPKMIERGFGRIVNTTSGIRLEPEQAGYSASKAALDKVTIDIGSKLDGTGVVISLTDPGWCRTDLGGPKAPNAPESALPGVVVGAFIENGKSGRLFPAGEFYNMSLEEAVAKAENMN